MYTKKNIEEEIVNLLNAVEGITAERDTDSDILEKAEGTVLIKVINYKYPYNEFGESGHSIESLYYNVIVRARILFGTPLDIDSDAEAFEDLVIEEMTNIYIENLNSTIMPDTFGETKRMKEKTYSIHLFKMQLRNY